MSNDTNNDVEFENGRLMLRSPALNLESIVASLRQGCFYWGTAPLIADVSAAGNKISVRLSEKARMRFIASGGKVVKEASGRSGEYEISGDECYVRIEVETSGGKRAGTQPFGIQGRGILNPYAIQGKWYKGNLHTHSTGAEGAFPREEVIKLYRQNGYDFLAVTDGVDWLLPGDLV